MMMMMVIMMMVIMMMTVMVMMMIKSRTLGKRQGNPKYVDFLHRLPKGQKTVFRGGRGPKESCRSDF
jgi:hypothetical protein